MSIQTTQIKLLASALGLNRADIAEIIALGGVTVSKSRVDSWLRSSSATKNATGNSDLQGQRINRAGTIKPEEFHAFCVGLNILWGKVKQALFGALVCLWRETTSFIFLSFKTVFPFIRSALRGCV